jgi:hypothetical protein
MNETGWKALLKEHNRELLSYEEVVERLPREVIKKGWLGYPGASEEEVATIEKRLAMSLPPSYRAFLKVSNGWRFPSVSIIPDLTPAAKIAWFREHNQDWIDVYVGPSAEQQPISDEEYFEYGDKQNSCNFRVEYLQNALQVSDVSDGAVVLLNPKIVTADGEWETWFFANWLPGAARYRAFGEWFEAERNFCRKQFKSLPKSKVHKYVTSEKPASVKKAQSVAREGETELALRSLESFAAKGDDSAAASLAELYAFLGDWNKVIANAGRLIANPGAVYAGNVFLEMINLLGRAGHRSGEWRRVAEVAEAAQKANAHRDFTKGKETYRSSYEKILRNLIQYAKRSGKPPHELLAIFGVHDPMERMSRKEREAWYQNAVKNVDAIRPDLKNNPIAKAEYFFSLAKGELEDEALRLYEAHGATFLMAWQAAEFVAGVYVRRGNPETAWSAILSNLSKWLPVDNSQVTPLILLTDEHLSTLMTRERCELVLSTPRGPEAAKAGKK